MIKSGRYGQVLYDASATTPVEVISINAWKASFKTDKLDVTCFGDDNKVYVPGMKDVTGTIGGFWNSAAGASGVIFDGADAETPGKLKLLPNETESAFFWSGLAYLDAEIDCSVDGAPTISSEFMAAGPWTRDATP